MAIKEVGQAATEVALQDDPGLIKNADGETVIAVTADQKVGIGTDSPGSTLEVKDGHITATDADVAHGVTNVAATNAYGDIGPIHATYGGLMINGISDQESADARSLALRGISNDTHTDTVPLVEIIGAKRSGTSVQALADAETVLTVANHTSTKLTVLGSGNTGIGTTGPDRTLDVLHASDPQLRLTQADGSVFTDLQTDSNGGMIVSTTGQNSVLKSDTARVDLTLQNSSAVGTPGSNNGLRISQDGDNCTIHNHGDDQSGGYIRFMIANGVAMTLSKVDSDRNMVTTGEMTMGDAAGDAHTINGTLAWATAAATPSTPADGAGGIVYVKDDDKLYYISDAVAETEISAAAAAATTISAITADPAPAVAGTFYVCTTSGGAFTVALPGVSSGAEINILTKDSGTSGNAVTINADGVETINGSLTIALTGDYQTVTLISDGTEWYIR